MVLKPPTVFALRCLALGRSRHFVRIVFPGKVGWGSLAAITATNHALCLSKLHYLSNHPVLTQPLQCPHDL